MIHSKLSAVVRRHHHLRRLFLQGMGDLVFRIGLSRTCALEGNSCEGPKANCRRMGPAQSGHVPSRRRLDESRTEICGPLGPELLVGQRWPSLCPRLASCLTPGLGEDLDVWALHDSAVLMGLGQVYQLCQCPPQPSQPLHLCCLPALPFSSA